MLRGFVTAVAAFAARRRAVGAGLVTAPLMAAALLAGAGTAASAAPPSDGPRAELRGIINNVTTPTFRRFHVTDSAGRTMDTAKVIQDSTGGYLAVYHTLLSDDRFHAAVATSTDLRNWTFVHDFGAGSSQPTIIQAPDGGFVMAWEQDPANHIAVRYFNSRSTLLSGQASRTFNAPQTLSTCAEGTPNVYSVKLSPDIAHSTIDIGGHFNSHCDVDRQMRATLTNFSSWSATPQPNFDNALLFFGVQGNIGDRDAFLYKGFEYGVIEGQFAKGDFGSFRTFIFDYSTGNADMLSIRTPGGSQAFANPALTVIRTPDGKSAVFVSLFIPSESSGPGESGELMYYATF